MKIYKLDIDVAKPVKQVLDVPTNEGEYGIAVNVTKGGRKIRNLSCELAVAGQTVSPSGTLADGSFVFKLEPSDATGMKVYASAIPDEQPGGEQYGGNNMNIKTPTAFVFKANETYYLDELNPYGYLTAPVATEVVNGAATGLSNTTEYAMQAADINHKITFSLCDPYKRVNYSENIFGKMVPMDVESFSIDHDVSCGQMFRWSKGTTLTWKASYCGYNVSADIDVELRPGRKAIYDFTIPDSDVKVENLSAGTFALSGVAYEPTTISADGSEYTVLAQA